MRVALLGAGRIGRLHARLLAATPGRRRARDRRRDAGAGGRGRRRGGRPRDARRLEAALDEADAVVIAAATTAHADLIRASADRGLPTFCEKPLAEDIAAHDRRRRPRSSATGIPFQLGFQRRFDAGYARGAPDDRDRRARDALQLPPRRPRPRAAARGATSRSRAACSATSRSTTST